MLRCPYRWAASPSKPNTLVEILPEEFGGKHQMLRVAPVRLRDGFAARRLGSATTKRSGDSNEIEPVILVGY